MKKLQLKGVHLLFVFVFVFGFAGEPSPVFAGSGEEIKNDLDEKGIFGVIVDVNVGINVPKSKNPYIPDGEEDVNIWATLIRPVKSNHEKLPTILVNSGYTRFVSALAAFIVPYGYNMVVLDLRGTGSSGGEWAPFEPVSRYDVKYVIDDWIPSQKWSDEKVGIIGFSYLAIASMLSTGLVDRDAETGVPDHLKAIVPISFQSDTYREVAFQGGNMNIELLLTWILGTSGMAAGLPPFLFLGDDLFQATDEDIEEAYDIWYTHLIKIPKYLGWIMDMDHLTNGSFWKNKSPMLNWPVKPDGGWETPHGDHVIPSKLPVLTGTGWFDLFTHGTLNFYQYGLSKHSVLDKGMIIGEWSHFGACAGLGLPAMETMKLYVRWFDWKLKGKEDCFMAEFPVLLRVMGENRWRAEKSWPLPESRLEKRTLYLSKKEASKIEDDFFTNDKENQLYSIVDTLTSTDLKGDHPVMKHWISPQALHGVTSRSAQRWLYGGLINLSNLYKLGMGINIDEDVDWEDERNDEWKVPTFTTEPLEEDLEIIGPVVLKFWAKTKYTHKYTQNAVHFISEMFESLLGYKSNLMVREMDKEDVQWVVSINDVFPNGRARNVASGWLAASHRQKDPNESSLAEEHALDPDYTPFDPFYFGPGENPELIEEDELYQYAVEIWPTCNVFKAGHRIRLSLSGSDFPHLLPILRPSSNTIVIDEDHLAEINFTTTNTNDEGDKWKWIGPAGYKLDKTFNNYLLHHKDDPEDYIVPTENDPISESTDEYAASSGSSGENTEFTAETSEPDGAVSVDASLEKESGLSSSKENMESDSSKEGFVSDENQTSISNSQSESSTGSGCFIQMLLEG